MKTLPPQFSFRRLTQVHSRRRVSTTYTYDGINRRILKTTLTETRHFYYNRNWQCLLETAENQPNTHYLWGIRYLDDLITRTQNSQPLYTLTDPNWNVVALVDSTGIPVERYAYTAFGKFNIYDGNFTRRPSSNYNWTRTFTAQVLDHETGLMLYRNRFYHMDFGRFIIRDLFYNLSGSKNIYRYADNQPISNKDTWGLFTSCDDLLRTAQDMLQDHDIYKKAMQCSKKIDIHCKRDCKFPDHLHKISAVTRDGNPIEICFEKSKVCGTRTSTNQAHFTALLLHELYHAVKYCYKKSDEILDCEKEEQEAYEIQANYLYPLDQGNQECQERWQRWFVDKNIPVSCGKVSPDLSPPNCRPAIRFEGITIFENGNFILWSPSTTVKPSSY